MNVIIILSCIFVLLNIYDVYITYKILEKENGYEVNPLIRVFQNRNKHGIIFVKSMSVMAALFFIFILYMLSYKLCLIIITILNLIYVGVISFNFYQEKKD